MKTWSTDDPILFESLYPAPRNACSATISCLTDNGILKLFDALHTAALVVNNPTFNTTVVTSRYQCPVV